MVVKRGYEFTGSDGSLKVLLGSIVIMKANLVNGVYILEGSTIICTVKVLVMTMLIFGELSKQELLCGDKIQKLNLCENYVLGKSRRIKLNTSTYTTQGILEYVHSDL